MQNFINFKITMMKKLLGCFFVLTMFTLSISCQEEEFTEIQASSSSNKAMDFGSHSENAMSDFQTDKDRPLSDAYYRDYVEKRNEYGVSYTYGIISVNPKDYATKADKPISWIPVL